jgi:hypothetical protein
MRIDLTTRAFVALVLGLVATGAAHAAQRTFVSGSGSDANACTLTAPCRGFARAMSQTNVGGEIVALDSAGYGAFTIDRSVSVITPPGVYAGVSAFAPFAGITVDAPGAKVALRGLSINGQGGTPGIWMKTGAELHVEGCVVSGLVDGIVIQAGSTSVKDTIVRDNSNDGISMSSGAALHLDRVRLQSNAGHGVQIVTMNVNVRASIANSVVTDNGWDGIMAYAVDNSLLVVDIVATEVTSNGWVGLTNPAIEMLAGSPTAKTESSIATSTIARNRSDGVYVKSGTGGVPHVSVTDSTIAGNYGYGVYNSGVASTVIVSRNTVTRNGSGGLVNAGGAVYSARDNRMQGNFGVGDTSGTIATLTGL